MERRAGIGNQAGEVTITVKYGTLVETCTVFVVVRPTADAIANANSNNVTFNTNYGRIDVIWLGTDNTEKDEPNEPELYENLGNQKLMPIIWDQTAGEWQEYTKTDNSWYNYRGANGRVDERQSQWANARNIDGSYFVWIPRFAYRITYYESQTSTQPTGYYDGDGMWRASDASVKYLLDNGIEKVEHNGYSYIVHPAFMKDNDKVGLDNYDRGGWKISRCVIKYNRKCIWRI